MSSTISVVHTSQAIVTEKFSGADAGNPDATFGGSIAEAGTLTASSTPPVTKHALFSKPLSTGTGTIDLTALPGITADETVNGTGLKVQFLKFKNPSTNANKITAAKGGSNGYQLDGATTWSVPLAPGQSVFFELDDAADDIGSGNKTIDLTGTGSQALSVQVVMG